MVSDRSRGTAYSHEVPPAVNTQSGTVQLLLE